MGRTDERDIYTRSLASAPNRATLDAVRRFKLSNPESFSSFEVQTMKAINRLAVAVQNLNNGNLAADEPSAKIALAVLDFMNQSFPSAHWTVIED